MSIKPKVDYRFSPPTNSSFLPRTWWSVPNLVKIGEELRTLSSRIEVIHTDIRTEKPPCAPDLIIYHFFAILANVVDKNVQHTIVVPYVFNVLYVGGKIRVF